MPMKNRRSAQIASVIFALGMLTTYLVYSQRQPARSVAPSSKLILLDEFKQWGTSGNQPTNVLIRDKIAVAPGSKSMAPILAIRPSTPVGATNALMSGAQRMMVAPGSKYGPVFDAPKVQAVIQQRQTPSPDLTKLVTNAAASSGIPRQ